MVYRGPDYKQPPVPRKAQLINVLQPGTAPAGRFETLPGTGLRCYVSGGDLVAAPAAAGSAGAVAEPQAPAQSDGSAVGGAVGGAPVKPKAALLVLHDVFGLRSEQAGNTLQVSAVKTSTVLHVLQLVQHVPVHGSGYPANRRDLVVLPCAVTCCAVQQLAVLGAGCFFSCVRPTRSPGIKQTTS